MSEWRQVELGQIADVRVSNVDKKTVPGEIPVQLCNYMDVYSNDYIRGHLDFMQASATVTEIARFKVELGDVLITKDSETPDDIGIPSVVTDEIDNLICGYHVALIKPNKSVVDSVYLSKQLGRAETAGYFARYAAGSTRYGLPMGAMNRTPIALPSLAQQRKIASILSTIDTAIEQTEALIEKYQHIKAGLMYDLFTRGVLPNGQLRPPREQAPELYQETAIGWIPREWSLFPLQQIADVLDAQPDHRTPQESINGIPYVGIGDFDAYQELSLGTCRKVVKEAYDKQRQRFEIQTGDVIFGKIGTIGQPKRLPFGGYAVSANVILFKPKIDALYFYYSVCSSVFEKQISNITNTTSQPALGIEKVRNVQVATPETSEAKEIGRRLHTVALGVASERQLQDKLKQQKIGLMQDLLTGRVSVP